MSYRFFDDDELRCRCCGQQRMDPAFMRKIDNLRHACNTPFVVSSAYRCSEHNQQVSKTGPNGPHTTGRAIDIKVYGMLAFKLLSLAPHVGITGIGVSQDAREFYKRFIHLDDLEGPNRPWVWSY